MKGLGLTNYETRCYMGLLTRHSMTANELTQIVEVPRTKLYESLTSLSDKGFVDKIDGKPIQFIAKSPSFVIGQMRENLINQLDSVIDILQEVWSEREYIKSEPINLYHSSYEQISAFTHSLEGTTQRCTLFLRLLVKDEIDKLLKILQRLSKKGIEITIVLHPNIRAKLTNVQEQLLKQISRYIIAPIPVRVMFIDDKEMLLSIPISKDFDKNVFNYNPNLLRTVHIRINQIVEMMRKSLMIVVQDIQAND